MLSSRHAFGLYALAGADRAVGTKLQELVRGCARCSADNGSGDEELACNDPGERKPWTTLLQKVQSQDAWSPKSRSPGRKVL